MIYVTHCISNQQETGLEAYIRLMTGGEAPDITPKFNTFKTENPRPTEHTREFGTPNVSIADYTTFSIPKRSGGQRTITAPLPQLKQKQKDLLRYMIEDMKLLPHNAAHAFTKGRGIVTAIKAHQDNESMYFLKLDIKDFFPNCTPEFLTEQLLQIYPLCNHSGFVGSVIGWGTLNNGLPQGAPTSPLLSNLAMIPIDFHIQNILHSKGEFVYTRYADDILISSKLSFRFKDIVESIEHVFLTHNAPFTINHAKTRYGTRRGRNWNLGIMLNKDNVMTVGHAKRERLRAKTFSLLTEIKNRTMPMTQRQKSQVAVLTGELAFAIQIYPSIRAMVEKTEAKVGLSFREIDIIVRNGL